MEFFKLQNLFGSFHSSLLFGKVLLLFIHFISELIELPFEFSFVLLSFFMTAILISLSFVSQPAVILSFFLENCHFLSLLALPWWSMLLNGLFLCWCI